MKHALSIFYSKCNSKYLYVIVFLQVSLAAALGMDLNGIGMEALDTIAVAWVRDGGGLS